MYLLRIRQGRVREKVLMQMVSERTKKLDEKLSNASGHRISCSLQRTQPRRQLRQERFLGQHEPRDSHPYERHHRYADLVLDTELSMSSVSIWRWSGSAHSLLTIINDVLDFSKIEAGKLSLDPINFNLREVLSEMIAPLALRAQQKGLNLNCQVSDDIPDTLVGDDGRLRQVLINLIGNAIKFTHDGLVAVSVDMIEDRKSLSREPASLVGCPSSVLLRFAVTDTGIGIQPTSAERSLSPFGKLTDRPRVNLGDRARLGDILTAR
jgi:signal transduction histidine kinase